MGHTMMLFCFIACIFCGYTTAGKVGQVDLVTFNVNTDGSVTLQCETHFSGSDFEIDQRWVFQGRFLTKNTDIKAMIPSRYNVEYKNSGHDRVYALTILNPEQKDEGRYYCRIYYTWHGTAYLHSGHVDVTKIAYLPSPNYPLCSIRPSQALSNGTFAEFKCEVGETNAQITLKLTLRSDNGSVTHLGDVLGRSLHVIRTVSLRHNNSMFICHMTSQTFPTAYRNCSAGPLIIHGSTTEPLKKSTTKASQLPQSFFPIEPLILTNQPGSSHKKLTTEMHGNDSVYESKPSNVESAKQNNSNNSRRKVLILNIVGCASGALIISLLIIIGIQSQGQTPQNTSPTVDSTNMPNQADSEPESYAILNQTGDSNAGTMTSSNPVEHQNMHMYEHTIEMHSVATSTNQASPTVDFTNITYQSNSEPLTNAVLDQTGDSNAGTMTSPNSAEHQNMHMYEHTIEMHSMATTSNQASPTVDFTNITYQSNSEPLTNAVLDQTGDSNAGTMTSPNSAEHQNMHMYEHTIEMHSMATTSNQASPTVDFTNITYQSNSEPLTNAVLDQTGDSNAGTMTSPNSAEHQNMHMYEHTIEMNPMATSTIQVLPTVDSTYTPDQADSKPEPYAVTNQTGDSHTSAMTLPKPEYQNRHVYEQTIKMHL